MAGRGAASVSSPEPRELLAAIGEPIFGVVAPRPVQIHRNYGWGRTPGSGEITHFALYFEVGSRKVWTTVDTCVEELSEAALLRRLIGSDIDGRIRRRRFPVTSTIDREKIRLPVDGRERVFTMYTCGRDAMAVTQIGDRHVQVSGPHTLIRRLALATQDTAELSSHLERRA